jgi:hypothetical protein
MRLESLGRSRELDGLRAAPSLCLFEFAFYDLEHAFLGRAGELLQQRR